MDRWTASPTRRIWSTRIERDTYLVHQAPEATSFAVNSMVITGREPAIVDTGTSIDGRAWREVVFDIVDPADVCWILVSHDDTDHAGNLSALVTACPAATVVASRDLGGSCHGAGAPLAPTRWRSLGDGDRLDLGDRLLLLVRPPVWDTPGTLGALDQRTGVYWGVDAFACAGSTQSVGTVAELEPELWAHGMATFAHHLLSPWLGLIDEHRFASMCDRTKALGMSSIASAHSPLITDTTIDQAFAHLRELPRTAASPELDDALLIGHRCDRQPLLPTRPQHAPTPPTSSGANHRP